MNNIYNLNDFKNEFSKLGTNLKTKDIDKFNKLLIKNKQDVSFLKDIILENQIYYRTFFQVSLGLIHNIEEQLKFIENNFELLQDWWHVDELPQFLRKDLSLDLAYSKAKEYVKSDFEFVRRWGYVIFMPTLVKEERSFELIKSLLKNDETYYVQMAEAWLISYMAIYYPEKTYNYLLTKPLNYSIMTKAIGKINDSFRINNDWKIKFKEIRKLYKESQR